MRYWSLVVWLVVVGAIVGCRGTANSATPTPDTVINTSAELIAALQEQGMVAQDGGPFRDFLFEGGGDLLLVNGQQVQVWEFPTVEEADAARDFITGPESPMATIRWMAPPRLFQHDRMIVLFVNTDPGVLNALTLILGEPFA